jgi:hypothetical protein
MSELKIVERFLELSNKNRLEALTTVLSGMVFSYELEDCSSEYGSCTNVIVPVSEIKKDQKYTLLVAHYDVWGNSTGINDNTAAIATLLMFLHEHRFKEFGKPIKILFPDKEETGMVGSRDYAIKHKHEIEQVIVLDIVGYGDRLVYGSSTSDHFEYLKSYGIDHITSVLPSDNLTFSMEGIKSALIVAVHDEDLTYNKKLNNYDLGVKPKFYESFHERAMDGKLEVINWSLLNKLRLALYNIVK